MTKSKFKTLEPNVRGNACIIYPDVDITLKRKDQAIGIVKELLKWENSFDFEFSSELGDSIELDLYYIRIKDICWGSNLKHLGKILEKYDYNIGEKL